MQDGKLWIGVRNDIEKWSKINSPFISNTNFNNPDEFIIDLCIKSGYDIDKLSIKTRKRDIVLPRQKCFALCHAYSYKYDKNWSLDKIGGVLGYDHCMVLHAKKTVSELIITNSPEVSDIEDYSLIYWITEDDLLENKKFVPRNSKRIGLSQEFGGKIVKEFSSAKACYTFLGVKRWAVMNNLNHNKKVCGYYLNKL